MKYLQPLVSWTTGFAFCLVLGCGGGDSAPKLPEGPKGSAKAKLSYEGKAITTGILQLDSGKGYVASAPAKADGTFELKGPTGASIPAGKYKVGISPPPNPPQAKGSLEMPGPPKIEGVPEKFYNPSTSGVEVEVKEGKQDLDIVLQ